MRDTRTYTLTKAEIQVMNILWEMPDGGCVHDIIDHNGGDVLGANVHTGGICRHTAVARQSEDLLHHGVFFQFFDDGVLTTAATDHKKFHYVVLPGWGDSVIVIGTEGLSASPDKGRQNEVCSN